MSEHNSAHGEGHDEDHGHAHEVHSIKYYVKIWFVLLILLGISLIGPELGIQVITLVTAFGIAGVKAYIVAKNFMHLNLEPKWVTYLLVTSVTLLVVFFAGTSPDVLNHKGQRWTNDAANEYVKKQLHEIKNRPAGAHGASHGEDGKAADGKAAESH